MGKPSGCDLQFSDFSLFYLSGRLYSSAKLDTRRNAKRGQKTLEESHIPLDATPHSNATDFSSELLPHWEVTI